MATSLPASSESHASSLEAIPPETSAVTITTAGLKSRPALSVSTSPNQLLWVALTLTPGLGPTRAQRIVEFFGSVEGVFNTSLTELELPVCRHKPRSQSARAARSN